MKHHLLCCAAALLLATLATADESYASFFKPPGCVCTRSGVANDDEQCDQFDCNCLCDLTAGACDVNCCCDLECSSEEQLSFSACLDEGAAPPVAKACVERPPSLEETNLRYPLRVSDSPEDKLLGLLCVEQDNSAVKGAFYKDQGYPSAIQAFSPGGVGSKQRGFQSNNRGASSIALSGAYRVGDSIAAYRPSGQTLTTVFGGRLVLPAAVFGGRLVLPAASDSGTCVELNAVSFGKNEASTCTKITDDLAADCEAQFSTGRYISNVLVEHKKGSAVVGASLQTSLATGALLPVRVGSFTDSSGGVTTDVEAPPVATQWVASSSTCTNALKRMRLRIGHNRTEITSLSVEVETIDLEGDAAELQQEFEVSFHPAGVDTSETRTRSGNPGYISGEPTLGATSPGDANQTASFVVAQTAGFTVMDTGVGGRCESSSPTGSTVGFSTDVFVGCTQSFTRDELRSFCTSTSNQHPMLSSRSVGADQFVFPTWLETEQDLLGIFGNADPTDRRQWIPIESPMGDPDFAVKSRSFVEAENRCVGMPSRLRFEILWTHVGNVENPQAKILSAKRSFEDGPSLQHTLPPNEKQPFSFVTTVSWTYLQPESSIAKSPPPSHIFSVPYDVFYPFQM
ncbi:hypothetical protein ACHAXT_006560 [Thalassiosira profunda]